MKNRLFAGVICALCLCTPYANAQLSSNPDKFLGNITTRGQVNYGNEQFHTLWNQITCENETKWSSIEGSRRGSFSFNDAAANEAKKYGFPFKFHTLIWGSQYPGWMDNLSTQEQYKAIVEWYDAVKAHYPNLEIIDVVNEAVPGHAPAPYKEALGGDGKTGYDWIIKAFEMAYERWPNAILVYNDYNTFRWQKSQFIDLVRILRDNGAPVDAYGCQSHDLTDISFSEFKSAMDEIQNALKMPMYSTEYDIGTTNDAQQKQQYMDQIPYMWESDYCAGITLWGYIYGATWTTDGNSGIIRDGNDRPAMTWLREYMATDAAKNAKSPFPGMKKEASLYIKPGGSYLNTEMKINVRAAMRTKTIEKIELYVDNKLESTLTEAPYIATYTPTSLGKHNTKAILYATDGNKYERLGSFTTSNPRKPFKSVTLPGTIQAENFDQGGEGNTFHDSDNSNQGDAKTYRTDGGGVDITTITGGYAIGNTSTGEWLEYTVDVAEAGSYSFDATVSSGTTGSSFAIILSSDDGQKTLADVKVPQTASNNWNTYKVVHGRLQTKLEKGKNIIMIKITGSNCNIDKIDFNLIELSSDLKPTVTLSPNKAVAKSPVGITVKTTPENTTVKSVRLYVDDVFEEELTSAPFETTYTPSKAGSYKISAIAVDADGKHSSIATSTLQVRSVYVKTQTVPGTVEAEKFDKGVEGLTYHDSDTNDEGKAGFRSDNGGVDIISANGGYAIGYTKADEWLEYTVNVKEAGKYSCTATASSPDGKTAFKVEFFNEAGTKEAYGTINIEKTSSYSKTIKKLLKSLEVGTYTLRVTVTTGGCNIDKMVFECTESDVSYITPDDMNANGTRYNLGGVRVNQYNNKGITIINGKKVLIIE